MQKPGILLLLVITLLLIRPLEGWTQEESEPYSAHAYWQETKNSRYIKLKNRLDNGEKLSSNEVLWLEDYSQYLEKYFSRMPDSEKEQFRRMKPEWDAEWENENRQAHQRPDPKREEESLGREGTKERYDLYNGLYGFGYGLAGDVVFGFSGISAVAFPVATAGTAMLLPIINRKKYEDMTYNSGLLARHGKFAGGLHGAAIGGLINNFNDAKLPLILATGLSIGMGEVGFQLGKSRNWPVGRAALYRHYGITMPVVGLLIAGAIADTVNTGRTLSAGWLAGGAAGYFIGNAVANNYSFTHGDVWATTTFTGFSALAGLGIVSLTEGIQDPTTLFLVPALTTIGGSLLSHRIIRGADLSTKQAFWISSAAGGGALLGLALAFVFETQGSLYFLLPAAGGFAGHLIVLNSYKRENRDVGMLNVKEGLSLSIMPQNIMVNKILSVNPQKNYINAPVIDISFKF